ncbi:MAG: hypothetical protein KL787_05980 [Taibaiella sp.]|nr:hypothetical protein [Taibaiella sp.]
MMKKIFGAIIRCTFISSMQVNAQIDGKAFMDYQLTFPRVSAAYNKYYEPIRKEAQRDSGSNSPWKTSISVLSNLKTSLKSG